MCSNDSAVLLSDACRGRVSPWACLRIVRDVMREDKVLLARHEKVVAERLAATYAAVRWRLEEKELYWSVLHGPIDENGVAAFRWHLRV